MLCYQKNSQQRIVEIHKVKESRYSFPLSCFLCLLLGIMILYVVPGACNAPFFGVPMRSSKECNLLCYLQCYLAMIAVRMLRHIFMKDSWELNDTQQNSYVGQKWTDS